MGAIAEGGGRLELPMVPQRSGAPTLHMLSQEGREHDERREAEGGLGQTAFGRDTNEHPHTGAINPPSLLIDTPHGPLGAHPGVRARGAHFVHMPTQPLASRYLHFLM